jgi:subtilisin family serine protease
MSMRLVPSLLLAVLVLGGLTPTASAPALAQDTATEPTTTHPPVDPTEEKVASRLRTVAPADSEGPPQPWRRGGWVRVSARVDRLDATARARLRDAGLGIERDHPRYGLVEGWIAEPRLAELAAVDGVRAINPVDRGQTLVGRVTSEGDAAAQAEEVRALEGVEGRGVRVGVISDGIDGLAASRASGDLAAVTVPAGCEAGNGSEGRAMLEIVHDLAPGAQLMFASGIDSSLAFIGAVECLTAAGANVIVDDLGFFGEPYFEDGPIAQAVRAAVAAGVSYHTAAGNSARAHWQGVFQPVRNSSNGRVFNNFATGGGTDLVNEVTVDPGGSLLCVLQWDNAFGHAGDDYDLVVVDPTGRVVPAASSRTRQRGGGDPIEVVTTGSNIGGLAIERKHGAARTLELFCLRDVLAMEHVTPSSSIVGHAAVTEAVTVAAIDVADPGLDAVESFSSQGPVILAFPQRETRAKPDVAGFDGVSTAVPGFAPFFGTSAAAPHVAAVAALLLERNPFLTPAEIRGTLTGSAVDIGAPGFDTVAGAGRIDALAAVRATAPPECAADADCADADLCTTERCTRGRCVSVPVACDDGDPCNGTEVCDPSTGGCLGGTPPPDGTPCPDGTVCNGDEVCQGGACRAGVPLVCADGDSCTVDQCAADTGCQFVPLAGIDSVECVLARGLPECPGVALPRAVERRFLRARRLVARGQTRTSTGRQRRLVARAAQALQRAAAVARASRQLPPECASAITSALGDARSRARAVARALRR